MSSNSEGRVIQLTWVAPYRGLFLGEVAFNTAIIAASSGLAISETMRTGSAVIGAAMIALIALPVLVVSPAVTPLTERLGFYRILILTSLITAVFGAAASLLLDSGRLSVVAALGLIGAIGVTTSFHVPAVYTTLSWFVGEHRIPAAISTINLRTGLTWVVGPVIGATLVAHDRADAPQRAVTGPAAGRRERGRHRQARACCR
jgi:MFS family permease